MFSDNEDIRCLQEEILLLLKEFHRICVENDINYTLHGGSMLGAVREKGFIPWDDDADIAMMRKDYIKLCQCMSTDKNEEVYLDNFSDKMYKVWMKRKGYPKVWIDVFVYDYISERTIARKLKFLGITLLTPFTKNEISIRQFRANGRAKGPKRLIYEVLYRVGRGMPQLKKIHIIDRFVQNNFLGKKEYIHRSNDQLYAMKMILKREYMNNYLLLPFEDTQLMVSQKYHEILVLSYGKDYMIPKKMPCNDVIHELARNN